MTVNYIRWLRSYVGHQRLLQLSAAAYILDDDGRILLGRRADVMLWAPPSGVVQLGETPAQTVVREVREETGLEVTPIRLIGLYTGPEFEWTYPNGDQAHIITALFHCDITGGVLTPDYSEFVALGYFASDALPTLMPRYVRVLRDALAGRDEASFD
jgi:8-oxo-dGTP pyrophosphatase MutT (NUDIX family)